MVLGPSQYVYEPIAGSMAEINMFKLVKIYSILSLNMPGTWPQAGRQVFPEPLSYFYEEVK